MSAENLGLTCPFGGDFYVCAGNKTEFLGCCTSNPCADGNGKCPTKDRRISSFNPDRYANIPAQECDDPRPASKIFYTCTNNISFIGCCASNPCLESDGLCPLTNLLPATLSKDSSSRAIFLPQESEAANGSGGSGGGSGNGGGSGGLATGAIAGIAVGAAVAVGIIIAVIWRCGWHARKRNERREPTWEAAAAAAAAPGGHPEMGYVAPPHSPSPFDPSRSPAPYDPARSPAAYDPTRSSYATTAFAGSFASSSPPHSPYYGLKHPASPMHPASPPVDDRQHPAFADGGGGHPPGYVKPQYTGMSANLQPVSELDSVEHHPPTPVAELGDGVPVSK
ncbi:hypothetical protein CTRI78_v011755 [Colletotrichum trifolii]|uniref:Uncharacterized protein n=1 Tax=Colletotrichum trifolii TaxID=5466 RepID=A0A4R8Q636_COLTR|nr:hypothetical protein CTRI78_v011755 [Colletotrichum trifolii]